MQREINWKNIQLKLISLISIDENTLGKASLKSSSHGRTKEKNDNIAFGTYPSYALRMAVVKPWESGECWCKFQSESKGRRWPVSQLEGGQTQRENSRLVNLLFYSGLQQIVWGPPTWERAVCFTQSNNSHVTHPEMYQDTPRIMFNQTSMHPLS